MYRLMFAFLLVPTFLVAETTDFETATLGAVPGSWSISMTHDGGEPLWQIERDATSPAGPNVLAQLSSDRTGGRFPLAVYEDSHLTDGEIRVRFKPISGRVDQAGGLVWRYRDENNYYIVRAIALENNVVLYKVENGRRSSLSPVGRSGNYGVNHTVPTQQWSTLGVAFADSKFTVFFDNEELFEVEDPTFSEAGKVGLWTKADSVTYFDDFEILSQQ